MSANAACLPCPVCAHIGVFESVQSLRDRLIHVSTNKLLCPVCQEEVFGLDKLTIHLFSHVKLLTTKSKEKEKPMVTNETANSENQAKSQQKKPKSCGVKNKSPSSATNAPVKFVKIYPKLPVIALNTVPVVDISRNTEGCEGSQSIIVKTEAALVQTNTTCNICGLQFIDANILRMHRCLIHNIDENSNQNFTRYHCHLCPKNFKMRGSLMVHLRVAHFGFLSGNAQSETSVDKTDGANPEHQEDKLSSIERSDNKQWQCDVCRKCFTTKYFLKKHKRLHTGETPYACTQCNKTFTFQQSYHKHLLYHNDEKPHTCSYCGRAFKELSTLHNHQRIHTGEKPFSCETCGKCFRQRVSYLVHRRIHTGVMPYKCTACQKSFRYKVSQRTHKCQAQPPGTVVRQSGELVEKLKQKHSDPNTSSSEKQITLIENLNYTDVSEASAELVRTGAKLSLEDMESEHFSLIAETYNENVVGAKTSSQPLSAEEMMAKSDNSMFSQNIDDLIDSIPIQDKNMPSPSEILKNLCLSKEEDYIGILQQDEDKSYSGCKDFNVFL
uniref:C2H2-type domain-containing protein n=1 Tax=Heliothis virescens TaxID=7102 RepID=A0A2A4JYL7_HELVI